MSEIKKTSLTSREESKKILLWCLLAFMMTAAGCLAANSFNHHFPFGDYSVLFSDLATEYSVYLRELWDKIHTGGSIFYSWRTALGGVFWGNILYYVSSPLNIFALIFDKNSIDEVLAVLVWLRQSLAAATMCWFLSKRRGGQVSFAGAVCGLLYAFCGWSCGYYFCTIWLDVFVLMPLLLLGIEKIIDSGKPGLYGVVLGIMLFSNFYMTYFACVFAILYWLWYFFTNYRFRETAVEEEGKTAVPFFNTRFFRTGALFAGTSVVAVCILGVILVPLVLQMSRNMENLEVASSSSYFTNITEHISALFSGSAFKIYQFRHYPPAYTGVLALVAVPLFFFLKCTSKKAKLGAAVLLSFMVCSFNIPALDYLWHGFRYPTNYVFREAFLFSLVVVILAYETLLHIKELPPKAFIVCGAVFAVLAGASAAEKLLRKADAAISWPDIAVTGVLFLMFTGLILLLRFGNREQLKPAAAITLVLCLLDGTYTYASNINSLEWTQGSFDEQAKVFTDVLAKADRNESDLFFRTELQNHWVINDGAYFGYNGVRQSSSMTAYSTLKFLNDIGMDSNKSNFAEYYMPTPVLNSFFGVKDIVERDSFSREISYSYLSSANESLRLAEKTPGYTVYKLGNALPLGFAAKNTLANWTAKENDAVENQNSLYLAASGTEKPLFRYCEIDSCAPAGDGMNVTEAETGIYELTENEEFVSPDKGGEMSLGMKMKIKAKYSGLVYLYVQGLDKDFSNVVVQYESPADGSIVECNSFSPMFCSGIYGADAGETLDVYVFPGDLDTATLKITAFQVDPSAFNEAYAAIAEGGTLELSDFSDTHFKGTIDVVGDDRILCVTVPFDPGWTVTLDGRELEESDIVKIGGALYGIPVSAGEHTVEFDFRLYGLGAGIGVSVFGILAAAAYGILKKKKDMI